MMPHPSEPPHSLEAEASVLGSIMKDPDVFDSVVDLLPSARMFYSRRHQIIYEAALALYEDSGAWDFTLVIAELGKRNKLEEIGGRSAIVQMVDSVASVSNARHYATVVAEKATLRRLINTSSEISELCYSPQRTVDEIVDEAESKLLDVADTGRSMSSAVAVCDIAQSHADRILAETSVVGEVWMETRIADLNNFMMGMFRGDVCLVAGPNSMMKTAFSLDYCFYNCLMHGARTLYVSLDQTEQSLIGRLISSLTGYSRNQLLGGHLDDYEKGRIARAAKQLANLKGLLINTEPRRTILDIRAEARRIKKRQGLDILVIDYLQLVKPHRHFETRNLEVAETSGLVKAMAKELDVVVISISQLSRSWDQVTINPEKGQWGFPRKSMLRDSGALEQDANQILFPWIPKYVMRERFSEKSNRYKKIMQEHPEFETLAFIKVAKDKDGPTGIIECRIDSVRMRLYSEAKQEGEPRGGELPF